MQSLVFHCGWLQNETYSLKLACWNAMILPAVGVWYAPDGNELILVDTINTVMVVTIALFCCVACMKYDSCSAVHQNATLQVCASDCFNVFLVLMLQVVLQEDGVGEIIDIFASIEDMSFVPIMCKSASNCFPTTNVIELVRPLSQQKQYHG